MKVYEKYMRKDIDNRKNAVVNHIEATVSSSWKLFASTGVCMDIDCHNCPFYTPNGRTCLGVPHERLISCLTAEVQENS